MKIEQAEQQLKSYDREARREALDALIAAQEAGEVSWPEAELQVNMHCHTFFSYNGYGHSPSSLAWLARRSGWYALGTMDFDVLDAVDETLEVGQRLRLRTASGLETRVYARDWSDLEINSPGEPGVMYYVGMGFASSQPSRAAGGILDDMRQRAAQRNRAVIGKLNQYLDPVGIDYEQDVLPLTPGGNVTERHIVTAYAAAARRHFSSREELVDYWADRLKMDASAVDAFLGDEPAPYGPIRAKLIKQGGVAYVRPDEGTFPDLATVNQAILQCGAIPSYPFLNGLTEGEQRLDELLPYLMEHGMAALTLIPDRNWNVQDEKERASKVERLHQVLDLAQSLDLPLLAGTEMNKAGQRLIDDFDAPALAPYRQAFVDGADFIWGHTVMTRELQSGFGSEWAKRFLPNRGQRVRFYTEVGHRIAPGGGAWDRIAQDTLYSGPDAVLSALS